jgi:hypothetical protein
MNWKRQLYIIAAGVFLSFPWIDAHAQSYIGPPPTSWNVVDCGGSIATGGTAQPLFTAAQFKHGFILLVGANDSNTDAIYFSDGSTTTTPGAGVAGSKSVSPSTSTAPGGSFTSPLNFPVGVSYYVNAATTGDKYKCWVW